jgi:hypothetical protein
VDAEAENNELVVDVLFPLLLSLLILKAAGTPERSTEVGSFLKLDTDTI